MTLKNSNNLKKAFALMLIESTAFFMLHTERGDEMYVSTMARHDEREKDEENMKEAKLSHSGSKYAHAHTLASTSLPSSIIQLTKWNKKRR